MVSGTGCAEGEHLHPPRGLGLLRGVAFELREGRGVVERRQPSLSLGLWGCVGTVRVGLWGASLMDIAWEGTEGL